MALLAASLVARMRSSSVAVPRWSGASQLRSAVRIERNSPGCASQVPRALSLGSDGSAAVADSSTIPPNTSAYGRSDRIGLAGVWGDRRIESTPDGGCPRAGGAVARRHGRQQSAEQLTPRSW